ncbi:MAG: hypothetical protein ISS70_12475 [Phycisphaerae bacterium]|nr:hypothetical protein [Phycisphaerae bacterium]
MGRVRPERRNLSMPVKINVVVSGGNMTMVRHLTCAAIVVALFCTAKLTLAELTAKDTQKLSNDVLSAIEGNQATLDSVRTIEAILTKNSTHYFGNDKRKRIKRFKLIQKHEIRYDGNHFRIDQLETKFTGDKANRGYAPQVGTVNIDSPESIIDFVPQTNMVFVRPPEWNDRHKIRTNDMLRYQSAGGGTLKSNILASAKNGYYYTAKNERVGGDDCILLTCDFTNPQWTQRIWVVPSKGYCIKKVRRGSGGEVHDEYTTTLKEYSPGLWWFDTVHARQVLGSAETIVSRSSVNSLTFNESIDPDVFTIWGLDDVTPQTKVRDEMQGTTYTLAKDYSKEVAANRAGSMRTILTVGFGILALTAVASLGIFIKSRKVR